MRRRGIGFLFDGAPVLSACFDLTFSAALMGLPAAIGLAVFNHLPGLHSLAGAPFSAMEFAPAYGHAVAMLWLLLAYRWDSAQRKRLEGLPRRSIDAIYHHRDLEEQLAGVRGVLWGTVAGSVAAMAMGWILPFWI